MKKFFITLMCVVMVVCFMPTVAMAEGGTDESVVTVQNVEELSEALEAGGNIKCGFSETSPAGQKSINKTFDISKTVVLDLNNFRLNYVSFVVKEGGNLTIKGDINGLGEINSFKGKPAIKIEAGGIALISNAEVYENSAEISTISNSGTLQIDNSVVWANANGGNSHNGEVVISEDGADTKISGGIFYSTKAIPESFIAEGYICEEAVSTSSCLKKYMVVSTTDGAVASLNGKDYYTLDGAFFAAGQTASEIKLIGDVNVSTCVNVPEGCNITLDLNGHSIVGNAVNSAYDNGKYLGIIYCSGTMNIKGNGEIKCGEGSPQMFESSISFDFSPAEGTNLTIDGGTYSNGIIAANYSNNDISLEINGGVFKGTDSLGGILAVSGSTNITLNGGVFDFSAMTNEEQKTAETEYIRGLATESKFIEMSTGHYTVGEEVEIENGNIVGGTFTFDPTEFLADSNYRVIKNEDGTYTVKYYKPYYGGSIPTDSLKAARTEAIKAVSDYVNAADYEEAQQAEIKTIVDNAKKDIEAAKTADEIKAIEAAAKAELDKLKTAEEMALIRAIEETKFVARSKAVTLKNGKKAIKITWYDKNGKEVKFDGVEIFRSTKRYSGYGKEPIYVSKSGVYYNTAITPGTKYYYKVRGYVTIDGEKVYTDYSTKAWRTVK